MTSFLIDNNLPPSLVVWLEERDVKSVHVKSVGLAGSSDVEVWKYAREHNLAILTKDTDFDRLALQSKVPTLMVVRLSIGNATKTVLFDWLESRFQEVIEFETRQDDGNRVIVIA